MTMYVAYNNAVGTATATMAGTSIATGSKVLLQLAAPATTQLRVVEWGFSFNGSAAAVPGVCELIQASAGLAMTTAAVMTAIGDSVTTSRLTGGTTTTTSGYGAITAATNAPTKTFDAQFIAPTSQYIKQWPLGREPVVTESGFLQIRANVSATVTGIAYIVWEEC